jgi:poly-gamma-glutamate synthesis protein (capsule biosynthesis protein)
MLSRLPASLITLAAALAAVFLSVRVWESSNFAPAESTRSGTLPRLAQENGRDPLRVVSAEAQNDLPLPRAGTMEPLNEPLRLLFFGDLMLDRHVGERIAAKGLEHLLMGLASPPAPPLRGEFNAPAESTRSGTLPRLSDETGRDPLRVVSAEALNTTSTPLLSRRFDIVAANLEGAVTDNGAHYAPVNAYDFAFAPGLISQLKPYGFNFFNLANNHILDQGQRGYKETLSNLEGLAIAYSGCPDTRTGDCSARITEINGQQISFLGFSQVYGALDRDDVLRQVASSSEAADLVIVNIHWGREYEHDFLPNQQELGRALVDAGADIIIGHHPHVVQGMEVYKDRPIFYSLGNFIFDQYFSPDTQDGLAVEVAVFDDEMELTLHPLQSRSSVVSEMAGEEREGFLKRFSGWSVLSEDLANSAQTGEINVKFPISNVK